MKCLSCGADNPDDSAFCEECGSVFAIMCPNCGSDVTSGKKFCRKCGTKVDSTEPSPPFTVLNLEHQFAAMQNSISSLMREQLMAPADGENRLVTVLFADMSSSVATTSGMAPDEAAELVNKLLKSMVDAFTRYEGRVDRFLGDGALAVFGTPYTHENDPERAILAAHEIREKAQELGLQITAGINTGRVYFGAMGSEEHRELTVMGPVVNLAARIQGQADAGEILIGETTQRHVRRAFELARREVEIKGIESAVPVYRVERQLPRMQKARGLDGVTAELVGRDEELDRLIEAYELAASGEGQLACVIGEAGLGKTRLVAELRRHVEKGDKPPLWLEGRCVELDVSPSYWPFIDLLREYFGLSRQDEARAPAQMLRNGLQALAEKGGFGETRVKEMGCLLGRLLSVNFGDEWDHVLDGADSEVIRNMSFLAIRDLFLALAKDAPVVVVLDDLHWADGISIDLLSLLMESLTLAPLLVVCVYRPDREHRCFQIPTVASRKCPERFAEIFLKELSPAECRRMIQSLLAVGDLPSELRSMILEKSQGNPLFVEEVIRSLIDSGVIYLEDEEWKTSADAAEVAVPETVQGIILSRVDRLDENLKHLLQSASVIGRLFGRRLLEAITKREKKLDESLAQLEDHALIYQDRAVPEQEYAFKHVLARDAVYEGIVKRARAKFHAQVAEAMEALYADGLEAYNELLAHHYERAENTEKAFTYLLLSGKRATERWAFGEAYSFFKRSEDVAADRPMDDELAELYSGLAYITGWLRRDIEETKEKACRVFDYYESKNDVENTLKATGSIRALEIFQKRSTPRVSTDYARRAFQLIDAESLMDPQVLVAASSILEDNIEDFGRIQELYEHALSVAEQRNDRELQFSILRWYAWAEGSRAFVRSAFEHRNRAYDLCSQRESPLVEFLWRVTSSESLSLLGDRKGAVLHAEANLKVIERIPIPRFHVAACHSMQGVTMDVGDWQSARGWYEQGMQIVEGTEELIVDKYWMLVNAILMESELGNTEAAEEFLDEFLEAVRDPSSTAFLDNVIRAPLRTRL